MNHETISEGPRKINMHVIVGKRSVQKAENCVSKTPYLTLNDTVNLTTGSAKLLKAQSGILHKYPNNWNELFSIIQ